MLVSAIKTAVKKYGFNDSDPLLLWINESYHRIEIEHPKWSFLEQTDVVTLAAHSAVIETSLLLKRPVKIRDITLETATGGEGIDLEYIDLSRFEREFRNHKEEGEPEHFTRRGSTIEVYPVPSSPRKIQVDYIKELGDLVNDTDTPQMPSAIHYCIAMGAAYVGLMAENEEERANTAQGQFEAKLGKLVEDDMERQIGEPEFVEYID